jgi:hypothetical protein
VMIDTGPHPLAALATQRLDTHNGARLLGPLPVFRSQPQHAVWNLSVRHVRVSFRLLGRLPRTVGDAAKLTLGQDPGTFSALPGHNEATARRPNPPGGAP